MAVTTTEYPMTIAGGPVGSGAAFGVADPATGAVFAEAPYCSRELLDDAMDAANRALPSWGADEDRRRALLRGARQQQERSQ